MPNICQFRHKEVYIRELEIYWTPEVPLGLAEQFPHIGIEFIWDGYLYTGRVSIYGSTQSKVQSAIDKIAPDIESFTDCKIKGFLRFPENCHIPAGVHSPNYVPNDWVRIGDYYFQREILMPPSPHKEYT